MIIKTKLTMPPLRRTMIERKHLVDTLEQGKGRPLIFICGQAGSGKTSLATQWLDSHKNKVAWYSLDDNDNDPDLFFRYLLTSLLNHSEKFDKAFSPFLQGQRALSGQKAMTRVVNEFDRHEKNIFLVLDDFHVISNSAIHKRISYLIQYAPKSLHLVIISRSEPPFSLSSLKARNHITQINAGNLQFSRHEADDFFKKVFDMDLLPNQVQTIFKATEGWVSGLQLAGLSLQKYPSTEWLKTLSRGHDPLVNEYMKDEIFKVQPEKIQIFLLKTSILHRFNADLCKEITGQENSGKILAQLELNNVFIIALDTAHEWYRYHPLFAESLKNHLFRTQKEIIPSLNKTAALWNAKNHFFEDAFYHANLSEDINFLCDLIEDHLMIYLLGCEFVLSQRWLDKLPDEILQNRLILLIYRQLLAVSQWDLSKANLLMKDIAKRKQKLLGKYSGLKKKFALDLWIVARRSIAIFEDPKGHDVDELYDDITTISAANKYIRMYLSDHISWNLMEKGDVVKAVNPTQDSLRFYRKNKIGFGFFNQLRSSAAIDITMGHMSRARNKLKKELDIAKKAGFSNLPFRSDYYIMMAIIHYLRNNLDKALENSESALEYLEETQLNFIKCDAHINMAFILQAMGRSTTALHAMGKARTKAKSTGSSYLAGMTQSALAKLSLLQGNLVFVLKWSQKRNIDINEPFSENFEFDSLVNAHLWLEQGDYKKVIPFLEKLRSRSLKRQRHEPVLKIDIILAAAHYGLGDRKKAVQILKAALCFALPENYIQHFIIFSSHIADILMVMGNAKDPAVKVYIAAICRHCNIKKPSGLPKKNIPISTMESLTPREIDILKMIAYGYSNNKIAEKLLISINTVKFYNKNLFAKLDVKNRVQAGIKARKLKMI